MFAAEEEQAQLPAQDLITLKDQMISSRLLEPDGFIPARFTVTMSEGSAPVWEAMQSSPVAGIAIWRGELHGEEMRGTISKQPLEGDSQDFLFVGHQMHVPPPETAPETVPETAPENTPPPEHTEDTPPQNETP